MSDTAGCLGLCPGEFWIGLWIEILHRTGVLGGPYTSIYIC